MCVFCGWLAVGLICILQFMLLVERSQLHGTGLIPSDNGNVPALSGPAKPAPPTSPAHPPPDDDKLATSSKPAAPAKPDPSQKV